MRWVVDFILVLLADKLPTFFSVEIGTLLTNSVYLPNYLWTDCQGKMCYNGGTLDYNTCTCSCNDLYEGDSCQICEWQPLNPHSEKNVYCKLSDIFVQRKYD